MSSTTTCDSCDTTVATTSPHWVQLSRKKSGPEKGVDPLLLAFRSDRWDACSVRCAHALLDGPLDREDV